MIYQCSIPHLNQAKTALNETLAKPEALDTEQALEDCLTRPRPEFISFIKSVRSPLLIFGAGGKMGPTLAVVARRAAEIAGHRLEIVAASRFSDPAARRWLEEHRVKTVNCDLLQKGSLKQLPFAEDILYLVGLKFGTSQNPSQTWAINTLAPAAVAEHFPNARIVALSTGNVYPLTPTLRGGSVESDPLTPQGEYANAAVARERVFDFFSRRNTTPIVSLRLFYAVELRYGVLRDLADKVWTGQPIELTTSSFNCIWQSDANEMIVRSLALAAAPAAAYNLTSSGAFHVRAVAERLGELLDKPVSFASVESESALLGNTSRLRALLGDPPTSLETMLQWTAAWVKAGGRSLGKPTHFEVRDGTY